MDDDDSEGIPPEDDDRQEDSPLDGLLDLLRQIETLTPSERRLYSRYVLASDPLYRRVLTAAEIAAQNGSDEEQIARLLSGAEGLDDEALDQLRQQIHALCQQPFPIRRKKVQLRGDKVSSAFWGLLWAFAIEVAKEFT